MNFTDMNFSFSAMQWLVTAAIGIYSWLMSRQSASGKELLELRTRIIALEEQIRHTPSQNLVNDLHGDMKAIRAEMQGMRETMQPLVKGLDRVNDYLMRSKQS
ncbi:DUF2730 domain-containing protein [Limnobaculum zhutongyuii]|uniref:DUF2730 domain-containing protein n=1 Tax=Limnobaculum zhutongyuii TaxID=2498113 RepID=A0A411WHJ1_9GAMM|nr:DUF2730 domain-containing protein [Limnobaculum zhutongyuii]QBH95760.1 DUF2730 domain-containing protein [Limnobaculum zhutongyuii]QBH96059.1 DUF2730 domain-containing protein [Limnobaculum zhutongyuii]TQS86175.1 DUF2730 domain-containing protein [Limnobaculum zhutongyuii]